MATQIKTIINKFLKEAKYRNAKQDDIDKALHKIFNKKIYKYVHLGSISKDKLILYTNSSIVGYKIQLLKNKILEDDKVKKYKINDIVIKIKNNEE